MLYQLAPRVSVCIVSDQAIFLDVARDRYFAVAGGAAEAVRALLEQRAARKEELDRLVAAGLIETTETPRPPSQRRAITPVCSVVEQQHLGPAGGIGPLIEVATSLAKARRDLSGKPLASILDGVERQKKSMLTLPEESCVSRAAAATAHNAARRHLPFKPNCLPDSLALLAFLSHRRLTADLVFGVKLYPFSAHCWVQVEGVVLNDALDHVTLHTPILIV